MISPGELCVWCESPLRATRLPSVYCSRKCRQFAFRLRARFDMPSTAGVIPGRFAYADPPYPGLSRRYYKDEPTYAGEVDHAALVARLEGDDLAGWALSTSERALRDVLPLCPAGTRVCVWAKPHAVPAATRGIHNVTEYLLVRGGRQRPPGRANYLRALPARSGGVLPGRKPVAFCAWLFSMLGMVPGLDTLADLFPGTGIVTRAWRSLSAGLYPRKPPAQTTLALTFVDTQSQHQRNYAKQTR